MAINFPTTLDTLTNPSASSDTAALSHAGQHSDVNDAIEALEAKVGANGSSVTTSLDYLVKNTSSIDPGHKHTVANLSDTTISSPTNGQALTYDSATSKWVNTAVSAADASTTVKGSTKLSVAPVSSSNPIAVGDNDTRVPTQAENDALAGTAGTPSATNKYVTNDDTGTSGANKVLRLDGSGALPAVSGANLTSLPSGVSGAGILLGSNTSIFQSVASANIRTNTGAPSATMSGSMTTYTKLKEITFNDRSGVINVEWLPSLVSSGTGNPFTKVYKNGVAYGTEQTGTGTKTENNIPVALGDLIQIYGRMTSGDTATYNIASFSLKYDIAILPSYIANTVNL